MTDKDQRKKPGKPPARQAARPASDPVVPSVPLAAAGPAPDADPLPGIESTLVGTGGILPAMAPRDEAAGPTAEETAVADAAAESPTPAWGTPPEVAATEAAAPDAEDAAVAPALTEAAVAEAPVEAVVPPPASASETTPEPAPAPAYARSPETRPTAPAAREAAREAAPPARRGGFWPLFLGGVVAAGLGAGATWWAIPHLPAAWQPLAQAPEPAAPVDLQALKDEILAELPVSAAPDADALAETVAAALRDAAPRIEETARAAAADEVTRRLADLPDSGATPDALAAAVQAQGERLDALDRQLAGLAAAPSGGEATSAAPATEALQAEVAALKSALAGAATTAALESLSSRIDAAETQLAQRLDTVESRQAGLAAASQLGAALRGGSGDSVAAAADALRAAGQDDLARLAEAVPTLATLQAGFDRAARDALAATRKGDSSLGAFLAAQTNARSVVPREGDDPDAIQSRAGAAVEAGDIAGALRELAAMPEAGREAMSGWLAGAEAWLQAQDALGQATQPAQPSE